MNPAYGRILDVDRLIVDCEKSELRAKIIDQQNAELKQDKINLEKQIDELKRDKVNLRNSNEPFTKTFLVEVDLGTETLTDGIVDRTIWRLVMAKDKNEAFDKTEDYLVNHYITQSETRYHISVNETII